MHRLMLAGFLGLTTATPPIAGCYPCGRATASFRLTKADVYACTHPAPVRSANPFFQPPPPPTKAELEATSCLGGADVRACEDAIAAKKGGGSDWRNAVFTPDVSPEAIEDVDNCRYIVRYDPCPD